MTITTDTAPRVGALTVAAAASKGPPRVALLFEPENAYARNLLLGIGDWRLQNVSWSVHYVELGPESAPPNWLRHWDGDGVILRGSNRRVAEVVQSLNRPVVDLTAGRLLPAAPWVKSDDQAVGDLAARHFLECGFRHFAYFGQMQQSWARRRGERFAERLQLAGYSCAFFDVEADLDPSDADDLVERLARQLRSLPQPLAAFTSHDNVGQPLLEACRRAGLSVPEQVAVLGVDNDEVLCSLSPPPLSSIVLNPRRTGWEAAELLSRMMAGEQLPPQVHYIAPLGLATRQSSDVLAVSDPRIVTALRYIRENACNGIQVGDVLRNCPMGRRSLESHFRRLLGRTPREEILRVRVQHACELLARTRLPMWQVSERSGFRGTQLSTVFKTETGLSPRDYRRQHGLKA